MPLQGQRQCDAIMATLVTVVCPIGITNMSLLGPSWPKSYPGPNPILAQIPSWATSHPGPILGLSLVQISSTHLQPWDRGDAQSGCLSNNPPLSTGAMLRVAVRCQCLEAWRPEVCTEGGVMASAWRRGGLEVCCFVATPTLHVAALWGHAHSWPVCGAMPTRGLFVAPCPLVACLPL